MDKLNEIQGYLTEAIVDMKNFLEGNKGKGNNVAGTRVRKHMLSIGKLTQEIRKDVTAIRKSREG